MTTVKLVFTRVSGCMPARVKRHSRKGGHVKEVDGGRQPGVRLARGVERLRHGMKVLLVCDGAGNRDQDQWQR